MSKSNQYNFLLKKLIYMQELHYKIDILFSHNLATLDDLYWSLKNEFNAEYALIEFKKVNKI
ncbi:MAG: hypothetical protein CMI54_01535 [Parcubacteria group bacterium]|nr:hypothetical protein [Parcubacteria group bacterium]